MSSAVHAQVTTLLNRMRNGDDAARGRLVELVYDELREAARHLMRNERPDHTLQPTALVHEAVRRLLEPGALQNAKDRGYFFGAAAQSMRQVLVDHARRRAAGKRGGGAERIPLDDLIDSFEDQRIDLLALDDALDQLAALSER